MIHDYKQTSEVYTTIELFENISYILLMVGVKDHVALEGEGLDTRLHDNNMIHGYTLKIVLKEYDVSKIVFKDMQRPVVAPANLWVQQTMVGEESEACYVEANDQ